MRYGKRRRSAAGAGPSKGRPTPDNKSCNFAIFATGLVSVVKIRRICRIHCSPEEICREFAEAISWLKRAVLTRSVGRELWLCSYHHAWRFFQIVGNDLAELDQDSKPFDGSCVAPVYGGRERGFLERIPSGPVQGPDSPPWSQSCDTFSKKT